MSSGFLPAVGAHRLGMFFRQLEETTHGYIAFLFPIEAALARSSGCVRSIRRQCVGGEAGLCLSAGLLQPQMNVGVRRCKRCRGRVSLH